jgi:phenylalanine-4-hydroxylase
VGGGQEEIKLLKLLLLLAACGHVCVLTQPSFANSLQLRGVNVCSVAPLR